MAATWNVTTMNRWGTAMGEEFVAKGDVLTQEKIRSSCPNVHGAWMLAGANVQLGPAVCLARVPVNGRNFEYLSGEDPYLGYTLVQPTIAGIQSQVRSCCVCALPPVCACATACFSLL
jgi:beta-glucosidase